MKPDEKSTLGFVEEYAAWAVLKLKEFGKGANKYTRKDAEKAIEDVALAIRLWERDLLSTNQTMAAISEALKYSDEA